MSVSAHAKAILLGEHAVVAGSTALVAGLPDGVRGADAGGAAATTVVVEPWQLRARAGGPSEADRAVTALVEGLRAEGLVDAELDRRLELEARVPVRAGAGSSAALGVAVVRALFEAAGRAPPSDVLVERVAARSETVFHGRPSGVDVAVAVRGGVGTFRTDRGFEPLARLPRLALVMALTGPRAPTSEMVSRVQAACRESADARARLERLGVLADLGAASLAEGALEAVGEAMNEAQGLLCGLGLGTPAIDEAVDCARKHGALGAKLTGAGGGGCIVALCRPGEDRPTAEALARSCTWVHPFELGEPS